MVEALPFGAAVSCKIFEDFSAFLEYFVIVHMSSGKTIHCLDDFGVWIKPISCVII